MSGGGAERLARRMLADAHALRIPEMPDLDAAAPSRLAFARGTGLEPDAWQQEILESEARKVLMCCCRQSGKSTTAGLLAAHEVACVPGSLTLICAPSLKQSAELFRTARSLLRRSEHRIPAVVAESTMRLELANGARIIALPGSEETTRGYPAATQLILDEASRIPDALVAAVQPALATTNGRIVALSTPAGKRGWFFTEWMLGEGWHKARVVASECPRIAAEFLADQLRMLGPRMYAQEYECEFFDPDSAVFASALIEAALSDDVLPFWEDA